MRYDSIVEPMPDWSKVDDALESSKRLFNEILIEVSMHNFFFRQALGGEYTGVADQRQLFL